MSLQHFLWTEGTICVHVSKMYFSVIEIYSIRKIGQILCKYLRHQYWSEDISYVGNREYTDWVYGVTKDNFGITQQSMKQILNHT